MPHRFHKPIRPTQESRIGKQNLSSWGGSKVMETRRRRIGTILCGDNACLLRLLEVTT
jgi:hypothetical protein